MIDYEAGAEAMRALRRSATVAERNEAQTRFDLIDTLITSCLGWDRDEIRLETSQDGLFSDYELGQPARQLLIEAKREGVSFQLPAGFARPSIGIKQLSKDNPDIGAAISQALNYSLRRGIPIAAVANGHQIAVFLGSRTDGVPPLTGRALVFASLEDMERRFDELWNAMSKQGILARRLYRLLATEADALPPEKLSAKIAEYPGYKNRNPIAAELQILGGIFFEDILRQPEIEPEFLRECYTPSGSLSQYALVSREILSARYSTFAEAEASVTLTPVRSKGGVSSDLLTDVFAASIARRPIILLGDVGVGKTIFTRHFIRVEASDILQRSLVLYVDFGSKPALAEDLKRYVVAEFRRQLLDHFDLDIYERGFVRSVYRSELQRFERGIFGALKDTDRAAYELKELELLERLTSDDDSHLRASLDHLVRAQDRRPVVFLDNVDQRPFTFQEEVFLIGQALAAEWPVACFIALRPETFYRSKRQGSLTGYQPRVFTIEPPRVDRVIIRRLRFARKELERTGRLPSFPSNIGLTSDRLSDYITVLLEAFENDEELVSFVENMSGGNVRRALEFIVAFVGSGHVDTTKIFEAIAEGGYNLPLHEFFRAVMYGEHEYYYASDSPIANVFDVSRSDGREHFLVPLLVPFVERAGQSASDQGYVSTAAVYQFGQQLGFDPLQIGSALNRCADKYLLDTSPRFIHEQVKGADSERCRVTSVGAYTVKNLTSEFQYLDAMSVDTPIVEPAWSSRIRDGRTLSQRLQRADAFRRYLDEQWEALAGLELPLDWSAQSVAAKEGLARIRTYADRNRRR